MSGAPIISATASTLIVFHYNAKRDGRNGKIREKKTANEKKKIRQTHEKIEKERDGKEKTDGSPAQSSPAVECLYKTIEREEILLNVLIKWRRKGKVTINLSPSIDLNDLYVI